ncbi:sporulation protein [Stutzerimonas stutzeri]|uniref:Sporulation protein n=1 Tax=Stutzerimonas stutzeri TaxID=316 RepID=W8RQ38_STUST|nr:SPOR domain-containing protein [Stutzerimonas stutzeri]AHL74141.1 sporulation protein [Stutzerimonas stutzeri]MCQ4331871.1 SPOR domain-containing protein [Stutzerimonas stutzeri]
MRWLLMLLVILNLLLYLYHLNQAPPVVSEAAGQRTLSREAGIKLLSETKPLARRESVQNTANACLFLGGFDEESTALAIEQRLLSLDIDSEVAPVDEAAGVDYWVFLPPLVSRQASLRQLRELQSRNIDSYIITVGDLSNGISLGIFSRKDSAESVVNRLQGVDYKALIRELPRTHRRYWVRVVGARQHLLSGSLLAALMRDFPELEHRQMPCSSIATSE